MFRIPGSVRIVNALYNHYCADGDVDEISSTICSPNLPTHVKAGTHDVASTFKRLLSGLPEGILGSLSLFDALVSIQSQLDGEAEFLKTKQTKIRARLIALAIGTVTSQLRRDLICAVFGLLCLIGRAAETTPREDEHGRPLPTSDLMGYSALGIVFGPLLLGDLLNSYEIKAANATPSGPALFPATPPNTRKERRRSRTSEDAAHSPALAVDKIYMANSITEMLVTHWREVVRHMRSLGALKGGREGLQRRNGLRPSVTEAFTLRMPRSSSSPFNPGESPVPPSPTPESGKSIARTDVSERLTYGKGEVYTAETLNHRSYFRADDPGVCGRYRAVLPVSKLHCCHRPWRSRLRPKLRSPEPLVMLTAWQAAMLHLQRTLTQLLKEGTLPQGRLTGRRRARRTLVGPFGRQQPRNRQLPL